MKHSYFLDEDQLEKWVAAAENIREEFGLEKALGYVIGEKFYELVNTLRSESKIIESINDKRKKPDYDPIRSIPGLERKINLDEDYSVAERNMLELKKILPDFAEMIMNIFTINEIKKYLNSNARFGALGHTATEKEYIVFIEKEVIKHSLETEISDSLILGDMMNYFGCPPGD
jgi:hypothetical protein